MLLLDEAGRMPDIGFLPDLQRIVKLHAALQWLDPDLDECYSQPPVIAGGP
jgi:hypothetical protein